MRLPFALLAFCAFTAQTAWSQTNIPAEPTYPVAAPTANGAAAGDAPTNGQSATPGQTPPTQNPPDQNPPRLMNNGRGRDMTREERRLQGEARMREMLGGFGITVPDTQSAIIAYVAQEEAARGSLRAATGKLAMGIRRDVPPERMRDLLDSYKTALANDNERRVEAQKALDAKIGFSRDPRMEALLRLSGILGEGSMLSSLMTGRGSFGGGRDGGRGGPGGPPGGRPPGGQPGADQGFRPQGYDVPKNIVVGIVEKRDTNWLDVRDNKGDLQRYSPVYKEELRSLDPQGLALIAQTNVGQRVQIEWFWQEKRRIVSLVPVPATGDYPVYPAQQVPPPSPPAPAPK